MVSLTRTFADPQVNRDFAFATVGKEGIADATKGLAPEPDMHARGTRVGDVVDVGEPRSTLGIGLLISPKDDALQR